MEISQKMHFLHMFQISFLISDLDSLVHWECETGLETEMTQDSTLQTWRAARDPLFGIFWPPFPDGRRRQQAEKGQNRPDCCMRMREWMRVHKP